MIITISGDLGSGKSTIAKAVAKKFNLKHYSTGDFMRDMAKKKGLTLLELSKQAEAGAEIDKEIDEYAKKLGEKEDDFVIDSRLAWYFIPKSIKIYLKCSVNEAAKRVYKQKRGGIEAENITLEDTKANIKRREQSEIQRYKEYYGIEFKKEENYDLVIDTTNLSIQEVINAVLDFIEKRKI